MQNKKNPSNNKGQSLTISKSAKEKLSKNQEAFNKLTQKIEKLQKEIEKKQLQFDLAIKIYGTELHPAQLKMLQQQQQLIIVLWDVYKSSRLSKTDQRYLKSILQDHLEDHFSMLDAEPDAALQAIFSELEGVSYDTVIQEEKDKMDAKMQQVFDELDVDMDGVDMNDEAAMAQKFAEAKEKIAAREEEESKRASQRKAKKNKSAKQLESEKMQQAVDEAKQKNISTIYKQLAKLFHPDLEQDAERKVEKEILMKELIAAYETKNLHALLSLELKWIHKETGHLETLTDEKLAVYLQILREQAYNLEQQKNTILYQPQYTALVNKFGYGIQQYPVEVVKEHVKNTLDMAQDFEMDVTDFKSGLGLRHIKDMIKQWKQTDKEDEDEEEMFRVLFG